MPGSPWWTERRYYFIEEEKEELARQVGRAAEGSDSLSSDSPQSERKPAPITTTTREARLSSHPAERELEERSENRTTATSANDAAEVVRQEIRALYRVYQPTKSMPLVEKILLQFRGREGTLLKQLQKKFKVPESIHPSSAEEELMTIQQSAKLMEKAKEATQKLPRPLSPHEAYRVDYVAALNNDPMDVAEAVKQANWNDETWRSDQEAQEDAFKVARGTKMKAVPWRRS